MSSEVQAALSQNSRSGMMFQLQKWVENTNAHFHQEYNLFMSSKRRTAAESFAFLTLGIGSPTHSSVHPLSVVFTRTENVNRFACAGPPSFTHLKMQVAKFSINNL